MLYLASPWSHPDPFVRHQRYTDALRATIALFRSGRTVYSPIIYSHQLHGAGVGTTGAFAEWEELDRAVIRSCSMVWVLQLEGWEASRGIKAELEIAAEFNLPVQFVTLDQVLDMEPIRAQIG